MHSDRLVAPETCRDEVGRSSPRSRWKWLWLGFFLIMLLAAGCQARSDYAPRDGDLVFHTSKSGQSTAIQLATGSPYSHVGLVYLDEGVPMVFEAIRTVSATPLAAWIARGEEGSFVAKRLVGAEIYLTPVGLGRLREVAHAFIGKSYDRGFAWSDDEIYCSELVWKIYEEALDLEIGEKATLGDFDLSHPVVRREMVERWGSSIPLGETVVSPSAVFDSPLLEVVYPR